jgi:TRAP-type uncharacterized transport system fused permease subunit
MRRRGSLALVGAALLLWPGVAPGQTAKQVTLATNLPGTVYSGWTGMRLGVVAYIVPFVFVFHPALILKVSLGEIFVAILTASAGVILLGIGCAGYLFRPLGWGQRAWASVAGLLMILPPIPGLTEWLPDVAGLALGGLLIFMERLAPARPAPVVAGGAPEGRE